MSFPGARLSRHAPSFISKNRLRIALGAIDEPDWAERVFLSALLPFLSSQTMAGLWGNPFWGLPTVTLAVLPKAEIATELSALSQKFGDVFFMPPFFARH